MFDILTVKADSSGVENDERKPRKLTSKGGLLSVAIVQRTKEVFTEKNIEFV